MNAPKHTDPTEQAAAWVAILTDEACGPEQRREFASWLTRSTVHVEEFLRISAMTRRLQLSKQWPNTDVDQLIEQWRAETNVATLPHAASLPRTGTAIASDNRQRRRSIWTIAASMLLAAGILLGLRSTLDHHTFATAVGELRSITLDDGSIVQLNARSTLRERFTAAERNVELRDGEAIFRVAKNPQRPFRVITAFASVTAIGTQFNVNAQAQETVVTVLEGTVKALATDGAETLLTAGQQAVIRPQQAIEKIAKVDTVRTTGWSARRLYFENTQLATAVQQFARHSARTIEIADRSLAARRITGTFDSSDPEALVQFLARYGDTTVTESDDGWIVGRK